jgi:hypothetical protein
MPRIEDKMPPPACRRQRRRRIRRAPHFGDRRELAKEGRLRVAGWPAWLDGDLSLVRRETEAAFDLAVALRLLVPAPGGASGQ